MANGPLTGVRVVELGQIAAGPYAGSLLADLGADVVKVERTEGGDGMRQWPPLSSGGEPGSTPFSENFASVNRNKRSIAADLKDPADLDVVRRLIGAADAVIENYRPGVLDRLGLGYSAVSIEHADLVYCSISGYGQEGPYKNRGAFDVTVQAMSGLMSVTGPADGAPAKCGVPVADFAAGLYGALSVTAAIMNARRTGQGAFIDCSMLGSVLGMAALQTSELFGTGRAPSRRGTAHPRNAPYQGYETATDMIVIAAGNDSLFARVCQVLGLPEVVEDQRFRSQLDRATHQSELAGLLQPVLRTRSRDDWLAALVEAGVPCASVNDFAQALDDPQVESLNLVQDLMLPNGVATKAVTFPVAMTGLDRNVCSPPELGEHTDDVVKEWLDGP